MLQRSGTVLTLRLPSAVDLTAEDLRIVSLIVYRDQRRRQLCLDLRDGRLGGRLEALGWPEQPNSATALRRLGMNLDGNALSDVRGGADVSPSHPVDTLAMALMCRAVSACPELRMYWVSLKRNPLTAAGLLACLRCLAGGSRTLQEVIIEAVDWEPPLRSTWWASELATFWPVGVRLRIRVDRATLNALQRTVPSGRVDFYAT